MNFVFRMEFMDGVRGMTGNRELSYTEDPKNGGF